VKEFSEFSLERYCILLLRSSVLKVIIPFKMDFLMRLAFESIFEDSFADEEGDEEIPLEQEQVIEDMENVNAFDEMLIDSVPLVSAITLAEAPYFQNVASSAPTNFTVGISKLNGQSTFDEKVWDNEFGCILADSSVNDPPIRKLASISDRMPHGRIFASIYLPTVGVDNSSEIIKKIPPERCLLINLVASNDNALLSIENSFLSWLSVRFREGAARFRRGATNHASISAESLFLH